MEDKITTARMMLLKHLFNTAKQNGITQKSIQMATGIDQARISRYYSGKECPTLDTFLRLCECVGVYIFLADKESNDPMSDLMKKRWDHPDQDN